MAKRKRSSVAQAAVKPVAVSALPVPGEAALILSTMMPPTTAQKTCPRLTEQAPAAKVDANPDTNPLVIDGQEALRASPDSKEARQSFKVEEATGTGKKAKSGKRAGMPMSNGEVAAAGGSQGLRESKTFTKSSVVSTTQTSKVDEAHDPEADEDGDADTEEVAAAVSRPPPVNSPYLPLPWKGRLGYACLCTYLRAANPPVFSSRTCRIASILEHRHPLKDPSQPEHATKNRPDKDQPADIARGQAYVEALGLANARDIPKMLRWNDKFGIKFLRLSSEMFPFASHDVYGYKLAPFAAEVLAEAGRVAAELGHRLTTHPGQFTQLGSPRKEVIAASIKDLEYHAELLSLLKLPPQQDRDAVMILHMGGVFGDKAATLDRFRQNYAKLPQGVKDRLVLENDDVCYSVHDLLPICEELNIPFVLDYHHHNIIFDVDKIREGTLDIMNLYDRIKATWIRKGITQKMHYSEPTPGATTGRQRRKHNPRVATLPPCPPDMDLMIEAKDKEQAVFELMRTFKLPRYDSFNDIIPYQRLDENKVWTAPKVKTLKGGMRRKGDDGEVDAEASPPFIPDDEINMGGPEGRVYWPPGMEEWLRPKKREIKKREPKAAVSLAEKAKKRRVKKAAGEAATEAATGEAMLLKAKASEPEVVPTMKKNKVSASTPFKKTAAKPSAKERRIAKNVPTPSTSDGAEESDNEDDYDLSMPDLSDGSEMAPPLKKATSAPAVRRQSGRNMSRKVRYVDDDENGEI